MIETPLHDVVRPHAQLRDGEIGSILWQRRTLIRAGVSVAEEQVGILVFLPMPAVNAPRRRFGAALAVVGLMATADSRSRPIAHIRRADDWLAPAM